jgi:hypothetical protein
MGILAWSKIGVLVGVVCDAVAGQFFLLRWHPRYVFGFLALPLCGAAPTFLCRRKEK